MRHFTIVYGGLVRSPFPKVIDAVALGASVLFQFCRCRVNKLELDLLCREFQKHLFGALVDPGFLPTPKQVYMVGHDGETTKPYAFVIHHKPKTVHEHALALVSLQQILPVEARSGEILHVHGLTIGKLNGR